MLDTGDCAYDLEEKMLSEISKDKVLNLELNVTRSRKLKCVVNGTAYESAMSAHNATGIPYHHILADIRNSDG